jgi:acyl-CoA thioesterase
VDSINASTTLVSEEGKSLNLAELKIGEKVAITGKKSGSKIIALKLSAFSRAEDPTPAATTSPESQKQPETTTTPESLIKPTPKIHEELKEESKINPNNAVGGFIIEDPLPQYVE